MNNTYSANITVPVMTCDQFENIAVPVKIPGGESVLWDDFQAADTFYKGNPHLTVYTITETDGIQCLQEGLHFVNRLYYLFCLHRVTLPEGCIVWWPEDDN